MCFKCAENIYTERNLDVCSPNVNGDYLYLDNETSDNMYFLCSLKLKKISFTVSMYILTQNKKSL